MGNKNLFAGDPVALAKARAEQAALHDNGFEHTPDDEIRVVELEQVATDLGFIGTKYFVESYRSLSIPVSFNREGPVEYINFMGLSFEGDFVTYSHVSVGRIIGASSVKALCLAFDGVTLLPYFDRIPEDHLLHVPILAVSSIDAQAA